MKKSSLIMMVIIYIVGLIMGAGMMVTKLDEPQLSLDLHEADQEDEDQDYAQNDEDLTWSQTIGIIEELDVTESHYSAKVRVGKSIYELEVSRLEYKILEIGDQIDVFAIGNEAADSFDYLQWVRDVEGRLNIDEGRSIVVIDPGHGGEEPGGGSNDLWLEKDMALMMALELEAKLEAENIRVIMTRDDDTYINLYDRVAIANYIGADMFVSCHLNKMDGEASGVEVIYSSLADRVYANALAFAIAGDDFQVYSVYNRQQGDVVKSDYYFVHKYCDSPSYIIEFGFADNEEDQKYILENWEIQVERASQSIVGRVNH